VADAFVGAVASCVFVTSPRTVARFEQIAIEAVGGVDMLLDRSPRAL
jgi:hypothetical protein